MKPLIYLGEISYGIYILQSPVFAYCNSVFKRVHLTNPVAVLYLSALALIVMAAISFRFVETPLRKFISGLGAKKKTQVPYSPATVKAAPSEARVS